MRASGTTTTSSGWLPIGAISAAVSLCAAAAVLMTVSSCGEDDPDPTVTLALRIQSHDLDMPPNNWGEGYPDHDPWWQDVELALRDAEPSPNPVPQAQVALELDDGTSIGEALSDDQGRVEFEVPAATWPNDARASATIYRDGYLMHTRAAIARPAPASTEVVSLYPEWSAPPEMIQVSVTVENIQIAGKRLWARGMGAYPPWFDEVGATSFEIPYPKDEPFELLVSTYDATRWFSDWNLTFATYQQVYATGHSTAEDLSLTLQLEDEPLPSTLLAMSFELPERNESSFGAPSGGTSAYVNAYPSALANVGPGAYRRVDRNGRTVFVEIALVETGHEPIWYFYEVWGAGAYFIAIGRGTPDGQQPAVIDHAEWVSTAGHSMDEALRWELFDDDVQPQVWLVGNGDLPRWIVEVPRNATEVRMPTPPSNVDLDQLLGDSPRAVVGVSKELDTETGVFRLQSRSASLELQRSVL
jgi:hypothetical protein